MYDVCTDGRILSNGRHAQRPFRHLPPVAVPPARGDLRAGLDALRHPEQAVAAFREHVQTATGSPYCALVSSGRAALTLILLGLKRDLAPDNGDVPAVIIPAYGCPTTVQSVLAAGLVPRFCDVDPTTLDLDRAALRRIIADGGSGPLIAVVATHLYGLAQDVRDLLDLRTTKAARPLALIEDAAQAYGARLDGRMVGAWGAAGLYSLGRGKNVPAGHGGVIVARAPTAAAIEDTVARHVQPPRRSNLGAGLVVLATYLAYCAATHPRGWWWVTRSPMNPAEAGMDLATLPEIALSPLSPVRAGVGMAIARRSAPVVATRQRHARCLMDTLRDIPGVGLPNIPPGAEPVYLRLPIVLTSQALRDRIYAALFRQGIGVSRSYTRSLPDLYAARLGSDAGRYPGAQQLARCLLTLPTHGYMKNSDIAMISETFQKLAGA